MRRMSETVSPGSVQVSVWAPGWDPKVLREECCDRLVMSATGTEGARVPWGGSPDDLTQPVSTIGGRLRPREAGVGLVVTTKMVTPHRGETESTPSLPCSDGL